MALLCLVIVAKYIGTNCSSAVSCCFCYDYVPHSSCVNDLCRCNDGYHPNERGTVCSRSKSTMSSQHNMKAYVDKYMLACIWNPFTDVIYLLSYYLSCVILVGLSSFSSFCHLWCELNYQQRATFAISGRIVLPNFKSSAKLVVIGLRELTLPL